MTFATTMNYESFYRPHNIRPPMAKSLICRLLRECARIKEHSKSKVRRQRFEQTAPCWKPVSAFSEVACDTETRRADEEMNW